MKQILYDMGPWQLSDGFAGELLSELPLGPEFEQKQFHPPKNLKK